MMNEEAYLQSVLYIKSLVEVYEKMSVDRCGSNPVKLVDYRMKSAESIAKKLEKKGYSVSCGNAREHLNDLAGIRVVCVSVEDVYRLKEFLEKEEAIEIIKEKDYIKAPKDNGYQSLHLIVEMEVPADCKGEEIVVSKKLRVEVQIRTEKMHRWAQRDHRLNYKND